MADDLPGILMARKPTADRPLLGLTVLVVEDSRFACEAVRLLCLRSGARIRRADCLASARRHLSVYVPAVVIADLGLPDGSGADLIAELAQAEPRVPVILGTSGDAAAEERALAAGADGFLLKPITNLAAFQQAVLVHLPDEQRPFGLRPLSSDRIVPDPIALRDDLSHVADVLAAPVDGQTLDYIAQFLASLATTAGDSGLAEAATRVAGVRPGTPEALRAVLEINSLVENRMTGTGPI